MDSVLEGQVVRFDSLNDLGVVLILMPDSKFSMGPISVEIGENTGIKVWNLVNYFNKHTLLAWYRTQARNSDLRARVEMENGEASQGKTYHARNLEIAK